METIRDVIKYYTGKEVINYSAKTFQDIDLIVDYVWKNKLIDLEWTTIDKIDNEILIFAGLTTVLINPDRTSVLLEFEYDKKEYSVFCLLD